MFSVFIFVRCQDRLLYCCALVTLLPPWVNDGGSSLKGTDDVTLCVMTTEA